MLQDITQIDLNNAEEDALNYHKDIIVLVVMLKFFDLTQRDLGIVSM